MYIWNKISSFTREERRERIGAWVGMGRVGRQTEQQVTGSPHHGSPLIAAYYGATIVSYGPRQRPALVSNRGN